MNTVVCKRGVRDGVHGGQWCLATLVTAACELQLRNLVLLRSLRTKSNSRQTSRTASTMAMIVCMLEPTSTLPWDEDDFFFCFLDCGGGTVDDDVKSWTLVSK